jgi:hypothetical protein
MSMIILPRVGDGKKTKRGLGIRHRCEEKSREESETKPDKRQTEIGTESVGVEGFFSTFRLTMS